MKSEAGRFSLPSRLFFPFNRSGLRARMTISYMSVTLGSVLSFLILTVLVSGALSVIFSDTGDRTFTAALQQAQSYALVAAVQAQGVALDPQTIFIPGSVNRFALPAQETRESGS